MNCPIASARLTDAMLSPVVDMIGNTNSPLTCRIPVVISITAAAATTSKVVFLVAGMGRHLGIPANTTGIPPWRQDLMADAPPTTPVTTHYDALLAARYTWMMGGLDGCLSSASALLDAVGLTDEG